MYADYEIREVPIGYGPARRKVEEFLGKRTLRLDKVDYYEAIYPYGGDEMLAVGGLLGDAIRCIAVKEGMEDEHLANRLVSHLMVIVQRRGYPTVKVFTKPSNKAVFESLAFETLAETDSVVFMENGQMPLRDYLLSLERLARPGKSGVIVMNCNPFTRGHRYLIEEASKQVDNLYVIPLKENNRNFNYEERREMIRLGTADLANVTVCEGSAYAISQATFPTYFLKQLDKASENQIELDLQIFARYLAPALGATVRFVGTEPFDPLTRRYNEMMAELLPKSGIEVVQIERKELEEKPISASRTRAFIENNKLHAAMQLVPPTTQPYIMAKFAVDALQQELDTTPKPGLVDKDNSGAHTDMDYILMERSIKSLRPYFVRLAQLGLSADKLTTADVQRIGIEAEAAMLRTTHGVNTHRGALFALGITVAAAMWLYAHEGQEVRKERLQQMIQEIAAGFPPSADTHGAEVVAKARVKGARENAVEGYPDLFETWGPYYRKLREDPHRAHRTLLKIMSMLQDTNIYYRTDAETAEIVRQSSGQLLQRFSVNSLREADAEFIRHNISPGGCADMLSLTILINAILR